MATLDHITITGDLGSAVVSILIDSGASSSFIVRAVAARIATIKPLAQPLPFVLADGNVTTATDFAEIALSVGNRHFSGRYLVQERTEGPPVILGEDHLRDQGLVIDYARNVLCPIRSKPNPINVPDITVGAGSSRPPTGRGYRAPTPKESFMMNESYARVFGLLQWQINDALTDDDAVKMIVDAVKGRYMVASEPILAALKLDKAAKQEEVLGTILALQHPGNVVPFAEHQAVKDELLTLKSAKLISDAISDGKASPAQKAVLDNILATHGYETLAAMVEKMPRTIPVGLKPPEAPEVGARRAVPAAAAAQGLDEEQRKLNRQLGISDETFLKYNA